MQSGKRLTLKDYIAKHTRTHNIGAFCLRMRENRSVRCKWRTLKGL
jgi:hypothetical protein